jgi:hypothetical protein
MTDTTRQAEIETRFRDLFAESDVPAPDDVAHLSRAVVFVWYESKAFVLVDLDEVPADDDKLFDGLDVELLRADVLGLPFPFEALGAMPPGFGQTG